MGFELALLIGLIIIFIVSFCGLLRKIRQTYETEQRILDNTTPVDRSSNLSFSEVYANPAFVRDSPEIEIEGSVFPGAPPPYTEYLVDPPPKYEDILKDMEVNSRGGQSLV